MTVTPTGPEALKCLDLHIDLIQSIIVLNTRLLNEWSHAPMVGPNVSRTAEIGKWWWAR